MSFWHGSPQDASAPANALKRVSAIGRKRDAHRLSGGESDAELLLRNFENSGQGWFWSTDENGSLTYLSESSARLLGGDDGISPGTAFTDLFRPVSDVSNIRRTLPFILVKQSKFERLTLRSATTRNENWWSVSGCPQFDAAGHFIGFCGSAVDISEQQRSSNEASNLAMYDPLTGLPNRLRMAAVLEAHVETFGQRDRSCAVMLIDLDRFKQVNDSLGHPGGDALLKMVAERLLRIVGDKERVFRVGGDEFHVVLQDCEDRGVLGSLATDIIASLSQPYSVDGSRCVIGASIGVAVGPIDGGTSDELIRNADLALYASKGSGRGRFRFFSNDLLQAAEDRRLLEEDLRDALANGEIEVAYQPIVDAKTNCATGVEALVRWQHPDRGLISPALFIPIAEEANLIAPIGEWVLRKACEDAAKWPGELRVAVNVSPIQFMHESLPTIVMSALAASGLPPSRLELEITEGVFLRDTAETDTMFAALKRIGVRLVLDDFGTGYSSLGYLRTAPFDKIKIDQSFVRTATSAESRNTAIISAIVALANALDMETTAEGLEYLEQLHLIRNLGVSHIQGYVYSKPVSSDELGHHLEKGDWIITPSGHARQRKHRQSIYRRASAIGIGGLHSILIRNLSESGALIEGLLDISVGTPLIIDFGDGQLALAKVSRSNKRYQGVQFEQPMVSDGNDGLCTSHRVSPYLMGVLGLPNASSPETTALSEPARSLTLDELAQRLALTAVRTEPVNGAEAIEGSVIETRPPLGEDGARVAAPKQAADNGIPTVGQLSVRYLDHIQGDRRRHEVDGRMLRQHILPKFDRRRLDEIAQADVTTWLATKVTEDGCGPSAANRLHVILSQMYLLARQWGLPGAATDAVPPLSTFGSDDELDSGLTAEEASRLIEAARASHNSQLKYIVSLLMMTGARPRDLIEAHWDHFDLDAAVWRVSKTKAGRTREVRLSSAAVDVLRALPRWDDSPYLIANPKTKKPYRSIARSWDAARTKARLPDLDFDDLRTAFKRGVMGAA